MNLNINSMIASLCHESSDNEILEIIKLIKDNHSFDVEVAGQLARILAGSNIQNSNDNKFTADVASTGCPSSLSTLLAPLYLRVAGAIVPKVGVPGRPAGGIDCLAQIPGYKVSLNKPAVRKVLDTCGYAHFLAGEEYASLDSRMFKLRQIHHAQNVPTLVVASLLAKKLAAGVHYVGLDIRVAPFGNFGRNRSEAIENAKLFTKTAELLSLNATTVLTNACFPYQPYLGRCESLVALDDIFSSKASEWLTKHLFMCRSIALATVPESSRQAIAGAPISQLQNIFNDNVIAQGSTVEKFKETVTETREKHNIQIKAENDGFVFYPLQKLRDLIVHSQSIYKNEHSLYSDPLGLIFKHYPGTWVSKGKLIATVRAVDSTCNGAIEELKRLVGYPLANPISPDFEEVF